ncbi:MAG: rhomboid family intramembrane serine protease [Deltaproteobacteria bacterium]
MLPLSPVVKNLLIINIIIFVSIYFLFPGWMNYFQAFYPESGSFMPIQIVSHMFMHGDFTHIFFNMFMLYMFGTSMEYYWGSKFFLTSYIASGFGAICLHYLVKFIAIQYYSGMINPDDYSRMLTEGRSLLIEGQNYVGVLGQLNMMINVPAVGASGAVFGIVAGFATQFPRRKLMLIIPPIPVEARILIPIIIVLELFLGLGGNDGVAHFAHIGGAITGFVMTKIRYKFNF